MAKIQSNITELPSNCKSAADHMAQTLKEDDQFVNLPENCRQKLTELEQTISGEIGEPVALVAYRL